MELFGLLVLVFIVWLFARVKSDVADVAADVPIHDNPGSAAERTVSEALSKLDASIYKIFNNLILPSRGNTQYTEIDHVVVSPYGIFCIETKSHRGTIYGYEDSTEWHQNMGGNSFPVPSPYRQNYKHVRSLEDLLGNNLRVPVIPMLVFPYLDLLRIDEVKKDLSVESLMRQISQINTPIYDQHTIDRIIKSLEYYQSKQKELRPIHIDQVNRLIKGSSPYVTYK